MRVATYLASDDCLWDKIVDRSVNGTFLHTRRFLNYHRDRFQDTSLVIAFNGEAVAVLPAARHPQQFDLVVSHPGITYGGIIHDGSLRGSRTIDAFEAIAVHYRQIGFKRFLYKPVPYIYSRVPAQDDLYALFRFGGQRVRCELSATIDLAHRLQPSTRRLRSLKKAVKAVTVSADIGYLELYWKVVSGNLERKYATAPVHRLDEIKLLAGLFPDQITLYSALSEAGLVAGVLLFKSPNVWHAQYIAADQVGYDLSALDAVFDRIIADAATNGVRYFDFGTSNENEGLVLNNGLYGFKTEFGGAGVAYEQYEVSWGDD